LGARPPLTMSSTLAAAAGAIEALRHQLAAQIWAVLATASGKGAASAAQASAVRVSKPDAAAGLRFREVMLPHLDSAHNVARFLSRDAAAAQDIVQEAYLRAYGSFSTYRGGGARAWILSIVRNCHHSWRSERRQQGIVEPLYEAPRTGPLFGGDSGPAER